MRTYRRPSAGFTLIELMITVAIVGILAAVAYPSYTTYITKSNRRAAQSFLLEVSSRQQRYLLDARSYANVTDPVPNNANGMATLLNISPPPDVARNYNITSPTKTGTTMPGFTATATPIPNGIQAARDSACGVLTIDETGAKNAAGGVAKCW